MLEKVRVEIIVKGHVQGVGFRYFVHKNAQKFDVSGFVNNLYDGSVKIVAEGEKQIIDNFIQIALKGPSRSIVSEKSINFTEATGEFHDFRIN